MEQGQSNQDSQGRVVSTQPGQGFNTIQPAGISFTPAHEDNNPNMAQPDQTPETMQQPEPETNGPPVLPDPAAPASDDQRAAVLTAPPVTIGWVQGIDAGGRVTSYAITDDGSIRPD